MHEYNVNGLERDVEFLTVKAISKTLKKNLPLGGAFFYHTMSIYLMRKDLEPILDVEGLELHPYVTIGNQLVFADLKNNLGLGPLERYMIIEVDGKIVRFVNIREPFVTKQGSFRKGPSADLSYYDYYGTGSDSLESDCTTRGIRVRAAARAIYDD